jgi:hypothetical protein
MPSPSRLAAHTPPPLPSARPLRVRAADSDAAARGAADPFTPAGPAGGAAAGPEAPPPEHPPIALLLAQARLAALEDFRAAAYQMHAAPLAGGPAFDLPAALSALARHANPSLEPSAVGAEVARLAAAVSARAAAMARVQRQADAEAAEAAGGGGGAAAQPVAQARAAEDAARKLLALVSVMEDEGFTINRGDPWDPANTFIDTLLERRLGEGSGGWLRRGRSGTDVPRCHQHQAIAWGMSDAVSRNNLLPSAVQHTPPGRCLSPHARPYDPPPPRPGTPRSLALLWMAVSRAAGLPLTPWAFPGDGVLLKLQLPAGAGGAMLADPSNPGSLLLLPDFDEGEALHAAGGAPGAHGENYHPWTSPGGGAAGGSAGWSEAMQLRGAKMGGVGVKVLGPAAARELAPLPLRRLMGYALMDVKRTYLLTSLMEDALGIIRCAAGGERSRGLRIAGGRTSRLVEGTHRGDAMWCRWLEHCCARRPPPCRPSLTVPPPRNPRCVPAPPCSYMRALEPWSAGDLRDEGLVLYSLGRCALYQLPAGGSEPGNSGRRGATGACRASIDLPYAARRVQPPTGVRAGGWITTWEPPLGRARPRAGRASTTTALVARLNRRGLGPGPRGPPPGRYHEAYAPLVTYLEAAGPGAADAIEVRDVIARIEAAFAAQPPPPPGGEQ